jgi:hypothetical protein
MDIWILYRGNIEIYSMMDLSIVDDDSVVVWRELSRGGYRVM